MALIRTDRADEDLIEIWSYIAADDAAAADRVIDAIGSRWLQLLRHPYSGVAREDVGRGVRHLVAGRYLTLYRLSGADIEILRVLHGRRRLDRRTPLA
ncbi:type II toxin-antitoxin system RelE/ParE family toxin [Methylopila sp. M107]|uniref:type II toxin-antitoxin system RelE/ParE family toxin n=1 Tax=Methylopila sp. M107 TaxID=1101190 RepID=UPI00058BA97B|nr:type II toxin-antitoxin system RelE/ParE family toxin [Methylopila sp. M107]